MTKNIEATTRIPDYIKLVPEIGALTQWQREIKAGSRQITDADQLWRAACAEANAREWTWYPPTCNQYRLLSAEIVMLAMTVATT